MNNNSAIELLKSINNDYAAVLSTIFSLSLVIVTVIYVMLTYRQVQHLEMEHKISVVPTLIPEIIQTKGSEYFGDRRQLSVKLKVQNIGDGPALRIYSKIKIKYNHVEFNDYDQLFEYSYLGSLASMKEDELEMHFETEKIEKMIEDLSIRHAKNTFRVKSNPSQNAYVGPFLMVELVYSNIHGQFFKTKYIREILGLIAYERSEEKDKHIFWTSGGALKDDEPFEISLINPIFQSFDVAPLEINIANDFIGGYEKLIH